MKVRMTLDHKQGCVGEGGLGISMWSATKTQPFDGAGQDLDASRLVMRAPEGLREPVVGVTLGHCHKVLKAEETFTISPSLHFHVGWRTTWWTWLTVWISGISVTPREEITGESTPLALAREALPLQKVPGGWALRPWAQGRQGRYFRWLLCKSLWCVDKTGAKERRENTIF